MFRWVGCTKVLSFLLTTAVWIYYKWCLNILQVIFVDLNYIKPKSHSLLWNMFKLAIILHDIFFLFFLNTFLQYSLLEHHSCYGKISFYINTWNRYVVLVTWNIISNKWFCACLFFLSFALFYIFKLLFKLVDSFLYSF